MTFRSCRHDFHVSELQFAIAGEFGELPGHLTNFPNFYPQLLACLDGARVFPAALKPIFGDGIILTTIAAVLPNAFFNRTSTEQAQAETLIAAQAAQHI